MHSISSIIAPATGRTADRAGAPSGSFGVATPDARIVRLSIFAFWLGFVLLMSLRAALLEFSEPADLLMRRLACAVFGIGLTFALKALLHRLRALPLAGLVAVALAGAMAVTFAYATINWFLFYGWSPPASLAADVARWGYERVWRYTVVDTSLSWYFFFAGWALFYLTLLSMAQAAATVQRAVEADRATHRAQLRALRYQLNPHFLFNSLNTLSSLVLEGKPREADRMILSLAAFLRRILDDDPAGQLTLAEEFELHRLYLGIEARRFEDRLSFDFVLPEALSAAQIPALILQPLIENAVKHGVTRSSRAVHILVTAREQRGMLYLSVRDNACTEQPAAVGGIAMEPAIGLNIGLANTLERLALRYGTAGGLETGLVDGGGFEARVHLPLGSRASGAP